MNGNVYDLTGKTTLVTGASSGIGRAVAIAVAGLGGQVVAVGRRGTVLEELVSELPGGGHRSVVADLTVAGDRRAVVESVGVCHGVVHSAGLLSLQPFAFIQEKTLRESQALNYEAPVLLTQALLRKKLLVEGGSIVFITSIAARSGTKAHAVYSGMKAALEASGRCLALEVAGRKIRVNCVAPGMVRTAMAAEAASAVGDEAMLRHEEEYPLGFGTPADVASAVAFLLSDGARWITGTTVLVDGGFTAR